jgi:outer membrane lipoprotein-sorting protein
MPRSKQRQLSFTFLLTLLTCFSLFTGCASIDFKNKHDINTYNLARQISNSNKEIKTAKGLGWLEIKKSKNKTSLEQIYKIAWIAEPPHKIRITLISNGFPVETIVSNGENITLFSHTGEHNLKTYSIRNPSLEDILSIPVRIEDIICLLSGQVPIKDFKYAFFDNQNNQFDNDNNSLRTIVLKNKSDNGIQKIYIDSDNRIKKYLMTNWKADPLYKISFFDFIMIDSVTIPSMLIIQDSLNREVSFTISKFYKNLPVKKSVFNLTVKR